MADKAPTCEALTLWGRARGVTGRAACLCWCRLQMMPCDRRASECQAAPVPQSAGVSRPMKGKSWGAGCCGVVPSPCLHDVSLCNPLLHALTRLTVVMNVRWSAGNLGTRACRTQSRWSRIQHEYGVYAVWEGKVEMFAEENAAMCQLCEQTCAGHVADEIPDPQCHLRLLHDDKKCRLLSVVPCTVQVTSRLDGLIRKCFNLEITSSKLLT